MTDRDEQEQDWIGGMHAVTMALTQGRRVRRVRVARGTADGRTRALLDAAAAAGVTVEHCDRAALDRLLPDVRHQGCAAEIEGTRIIRESALPALLSAVSQPWVLALDQVQDPHNLGACLRSAAAAGVSAVIAPRKRAAGLTRAARKVAAGGAELVPFVPVSNLVRAIDRLKSDGFWAIGLAGEAGESLYSAALPEPIVWVAGGEAGGLRSLTAEHCDRLVSIPMAPAMESLNVSVATSLALFETVRRRSAIA
ncbi:23S rRNA (guanosine(2251)-2'-O)-methyltransferase RlmB [Salinisphaera sp. Q1T1-3]|uniref:23S rRNA (guanosine(2251)-2'-O)-methyltransferase RlmB n=1 Tax=Salinisphaera sp. Q1T1-3 TaxID=2321229 RepID=UPI000E732E1C|nr:23S rRNA (guanosine(2251)-2'-O)-methyltransferase RlmB [Salinisphaera sp. Q1T1-3]RJS93811.1 23S rRNA (guanosine(2251)-2'-O)-methyltransferase RlmB [Salinisphaera sp. Q1T1-3]